ncbi:cytochrome o ubiquinol oxidase subunit IV [Candidatus Bartonella washoeensis Sb944nv]|uniref:Cytochrome bo(3) ubiquinol oxidase subunit 4 n=1 Tax=Candidatus Bartonella washoeensis Sb944nv TaxID=1094563 RepID=J0Q9H6_9HYPH|nr:cytochrome o ubiquinol oxidase subunit IV [Bartonella washoeensis]EJF79354.1 cytochrome o ubiquinol oxidase subunit IV [Bartonella washoeensis Sb944nv]
MSTHNKTHSPSTGSYLVGFILAVFFTLASFIPVMYGMMDSWAISTKVAYLIGMAIIQIIVQIVFFLHLNSGPDAKWNLSALWFAVICVVVIIGGTWWAISHLNYNMMGGSGRVIEPDVSGRESSSVSEKLNTQEPVEQLSDQKMPLEQVPNSQDSIGQVPGSEMPVGQVPDEQGSIGQVPGSEMPVGQVLDEQGSIGQVPGSEMPVGQVLDEQGSIGQIPSSEMPVEQVPDAQIPVE